MSQTFPRRLTLLISAGAALAAVAATALPAQAAAIPGWRVNTTFRVTGKETLLTSVTAPSATDAWASGLAAKTNASSVGSLIRHWNGKSWTAVKLPAKVAGAWSRAAPFESVVGATSTSNVWIFGALETAAYLRLNGTRWTVGHLPGSNPSAGKIVQISAVKVFGKSDVWALGVTLHESAQQPTETPYAAHFNGTRWSLTSVPGNSGIVAASAASAASIWAVAGTPATGLGSPFGGSAGAQMVLHWGPKGGWQQIAQPVLPAGTHLSGVVFEPGKVVVGGSRPNGRGGRTPFLITWNGTSWSAPMAAGASPTKWDVGAMATDGRSGFWVTGVPANGNSAKLWHVTGGKWAAVQPNFGKHAWVLFQLAAVPHTDSVWGAGGLQEGKSAIGMMAVAGPTPR